MVKEWSPDFFAVVPNKYEQANIVRLLNAISLEVVDLKNQTAKQKFPQDREDKVIIFISSILICSNLVLFLHINPINNNPYTFVFCLCISFFYF